MKRDSITYTTEITSYGTHIIYSNGLNFRLIKDSQTNIVAYRLSYDKKTIHIHPYVMLSMLKIIMAELPLGGALYGEVE